MSRNAPFSTAFDAATATPVIVNESFVRLVLGGRQAIGRRVRYVEVDVRSPDASAPVWHEIVGVVKDLAMTDGGELDLETGFPYETIRALMRKGHSVRFADGPYGGYQAIMVNPNGGYVGASESRKDGQAAGY